MSSLRLDIAKFLQRRFKVTKNYSFDYWTFVHFFSGLLLMAIILDFKIVFYILIGYELFEWFMWTNTKGLFDPEELSNSLGDILVGMLGAVVLYSLLL